MMNVMLAAIDFFGGWYHWLPLSLIAIMTAIIIYTALFMLGRGFAIAELEKFAKSEMLQTAATAFMAIFLVLMVSSAMEVTRGLIHGELICGSEAMNIGTTANSTMDEAFNAIRCRLQYRAKQVAEIQDYINNDAMVAAKFNAINMMGSIFGITLVKGEWFPELYKSTETMRITNNLATVLLIALNAQSYLLEYLRINMLHVFIPVGILLRSFYFTRGPGALFISMGIGLYFIFPIFFVLLDPGFVAAPLPTATPAEQQPYCYPTMSTGVTMMTTIETGGLGSSEVLVISSIRNELSKSYISIILHPLIAFFLTLVFVRYMMTILGGDTFALMRMVGKVI